MLKYYDYAVTFSEVPDEIALAINITNCPNNCKGCSESYLAQDLGKELTNEKLDKLIDKHPGITAIALMGGDSDHGDVLRVAKYIKSRSKLKVGIYSGRDYLDYSLLQDLDFYKVGRWILPEGNKEDWSKTNCGPINLTYSNQLYFEKRYLNTGEVVWLNTTDKFRKSPVGDPERFIIKGEDN